MTTHRNKQLKGFMVFSLFVAVIAGFIWILPSLLQKKYGYNLLYPWLLVISRLLTGISRGICFTG
jgi:apolipoprotein N-acyltransferase